jgi:hypothetical protein
MNFLFQLRRWRHTIPFSLLTLAAYLPAHAQAVNNARSQTSFLFVHRTGAHVQLSTPEVFREVVNDIQGYLKDGGVSIITREDDSSSGGELPVYAIQEMAHASSAQYVLYVAVDRPVMKWLKVTVQCYDASGQQIWTEESFAGKELSGGKGERDTLKRLHEKLNKRLGQPGLLRASSDQPKPAPTPAPVSTAAASQSEQAAPSPVPGSAVTTDSVAESQQTLRLASGTPVHLLLAETLSSKTAKPGSTVKFQVMGDVRVGDLVVIANKATALGAIESAESAGRAWHSGRILLKLKNVTLLNQQQQPLQAWKASKGKGTDAAVDWTNAVFQSYGLALFVLPFAPLQHGNQAFLYRGMVVEAVTEGDALMPRADLQAAQPKPMEPGHGPSSVTFYYPDFEGGPAADIWCGQVKIGHLRRGGKFTIALPAGKYWVRLWKGDHAVITPLDAQGGGEEYVAVYVSRTLNGLTVYREPRLVVVQHDVGEAQSADAMAAKAQNVQTADKFDLALLQADPHAKKK